MINPIKLQGIWDEGYALDFHVKSSTYIGEDAFGHPQYDTVRTPIGEALYQFKYRNNYNAKQQILDIAKPFFNTWAVVNSVDVILPVPPSTKNRYYQPVFEIAQMIADYLRKSYSDEILYKTTTEQSKNTDEKQNIEGSIIQQKFATKQCKILLVDDLFQSGATFSECVRVLKQDNNITGVYILAITKTSKETDLL